MARTPAPSAEGAALDAFRPLDREQELSRGRPKRVDCRGSRCAWNDLKTFSTSACLTCDYSRAPVAPEALRRRIASYLTSYQQTVCLRRHPIDLKKRNATPLRSGWWLRVTYCYVA